MYRRLLPALASLYDCQVEYNYLIFEYHMSVTQSQQYNGGSECVTGESRYLSSTSTQNKAS